MKKKPIPLAALKPLTNAVWADGDYHLGKFAEAIEAHREADTRYGFTCRYNLDNPYDPSLLPSEFAEMLKDGVVPEVFHDGEGWVNQHYIHSLEQFYAVVTREWNMHLSRTQALIGTPAGTILFGSPK